VFSGAVAGVKGEPGPGDTVMVSDSLGNFLAWGAFSPESQIRVRVWSWDAEAQITPAFFRQRLMGAIHRRRGAFPADPGQKRSQDHGREAQRYVHAESDGLPGLVVDRYADTLVMQLLSAGAERWRETFAELLMELTGAERVYERSDVEVRSLEGLPARLGLVRGDEPPARVQIREGRLDYYVDVRQGHKTGFYLDQRRNRALAGELAADRTVLDCFTYSGGFGLNTLAGGAAALTAVDSSAEALGLARDNLALNGLPAEKADWIEADVFAALRTFRDQGRAFDMIVLDPPKFAPTAKQARQASRGYKDINLLAFKLLRPGGILLTFSCSGGISAELFQKIVAGAALDAGVAAQIVERLGQARDHPVALHFPEGAYLKGLFIRV
jgi:23S rRNA (cytosine1962-C5)-methyltransferase